MIPANMLDGWGEWPYVAIFAAAVFEGEIVYIGACVLAGMGQLNPLSVWAAGALGGSAGDQLFFYAARYATRNRLAQWIHQPSPTPSAMVTWVRNRAPGIIMASRFLPGLRIAIPVCCAYAGINSKRFSILSLSSGFLWAGSILLAVTLLGPHMRHLGLSVPAAMAIAGGLILLAFAITRRLLTRNTNAAGGRPGGALT